MEYTLAEAGRLVGRSPNTLRNHIHRGVLRARLVGKTYVVEQGELIRYAENHRTPRLGVAFVLGKREEPQS